MIITDIIDRSADYSSVDDQQRVKSCSVIYLHDLKHHTSKYFIIIHELTCSVLITFLLPTLLILTALVSSSAEVLTR